MQLLIGAGHNGEKRMGVAKTEGWQKLVTLDQNFFCKPNVVADLERLPLPFKDEVFEEIHAYHVLEHTGLQGDWRFFFGQFMEFWRILKPNGFFFAIVPSLSSQWAWGDPSHKRVLPLCSLVFLSQDEHEKQAGKTSMSDFRNYYKANFEILAANENLQEARFILRALK